ncbi:MAG: ATPase domain-containing protein [Candidatus Micrarchaeia archaeon]|jgi:KaiC/GvpD/RAD55 family RecA-like ATPase
MDRTKSGIYGLDELIEGGVPKKRNLLIAGACGTGKSILSMQFAYRGAVEYDEPSVYVTFDEMPDKLRQDMLNFGWNIKEAEAKGLMAIVDATSARAGMPSEEQHAMMPGQLDIERVIIEVLGICRNIGAKRLVIDSIPAMSFQLEKQSEIRRTILKLAYIVSRSGLTSIMTTEIPEQSFGSGQSMMFSKYEVEEYIADGVILLNFLGVGTGATRTLYIRKMRGTKHSLEIHPMEITEKGIVVKKIEDVFK